MKTMYRSFIILLMLAGIAETSIGQVKGQEKNQVNSQLKTAPKQKKEPTIEERRAAAKAFAQKRNLELRNERMLRDSIAVLRTYQQDADSLMRLGISLQKFQEEQREEKIKANAIAPSSARTAGGTTQIMSGPNLNLGFENGFTGWTGRFSAEFRRIASLPAAEKRGRKFFDGLQQSNQYTYPNGTPSYEAYTPNFQQARHSVLAGGLDFFGGFPIVPPHVGSRVARIGNPTVGCGTTSTWTPLYEAEEMSYTFTVDNATDYVVVNYAVVMQDPSVSSTGHYWMNRTYFKIEVVADKAIYECATYEVYFDNQGLQIPGFVLSPTDPAACARYKPWTATVVDLHEFAGKEVTLRFSTGDCLAGGHFSYAYVDAYATAEGIESSDEVCVGNPIEFSSFITGRYLNETYEWDFGDGTTSTERNPTHIYTTTGTKLITLRTKVDGAYVGCGITREVNVGPGANPAFNLSPTRFTPNQAMTLTFPNHVSGNSNTIDWGDGTSEPAFTTNTKSHTYTKPGWYNISVSVTSSLGCVGTSQRLIEVAYLCASEIPNIAAASGTFKMDRITGNIVYTRGSCPVQTLMPCVTSVAGTTNKVVAATATTFSDKWPHAKTYPDNSGVAFETAANEFEKGERGKWRVKGAYGFNTTLIADDKNFRAGTYALTNFNWRNEGYNDKTKWLKSSEVTAYSPHGDALSEKNALGISSSAKFGYQNAVPYLTAKNANSTSVLFESFEMTYSTMLEDKMQVPTTGYRDDIRVSDANFAHSGLHSWRMPSGGSMNVAQFSLTANELKAGLQVKVWVRVTDNPAYQELLNNSTNQKLVLRIKGQSVAPVPFKVVSRTGDWILCEALIKSQPINLAWGTITADVPFTLTIQYLPGRAIWFDDLRVQPADSEMSCYVYDKTNLRLLAVFDDQHFGMYYQYNGEGKLVRKMRETERGVKTIQETQYNTNLR